MRAAWLLLSLTLAGCPGGGTPQGPPPAPAPRPVKVATAAEAVWPRTVHAVGTLEAWDRASVGAKQSGRLAEMLVDTGTRVAKGDAVARLDATDLRLDVTRAEAALAEVRALLGIREGAAQTEPGPEAAIVRVARAQLDQAKAEHARVLVLRERGITTPADLDAAEAALRVAQARLEDAFEEVERRRAALAERTAALAIARQRLADATVPAPFDGVVLARHAAPGDVVQAGTALATIVKVHPLRLQAEVPERVAPLVRPGQAVRIRIDEVPAPVETAVARVAPGLVAESRMLAFEADVPNQDGALRAGAFCRVEVVVDPAAKALVVPASAVRSFAGLDKLLVVKDGKAEERRVTLGRREKERVEVAQGLAAGEQVVLDPGGLPAGAPVTVTQEAAR